MIASGGLGRRDGATSNQVIDLQPEFFRTGLKRCFLVSFRVEQHLGLKYSKKSRVVAHRVIGALQDANSPHFALGAHDLHTHPHFMTSDNSEVLTHWVESGPSVVANMLHLALSQVFVRVDDSVNLQFSLDSSRSTECPLFGLPNAPKPQQRSLW
ncbi:hypothetical protein BJY00DRAFT_148578 [Aspergillus carlsbadensis]|nr:hypothetical protein BJY00DRAFT_148578 [Aspergillus carlsbadensis]